jgi:citrate lyase subunit beta/citryl-CoA lyase
MARRSLLFTPGDRPEMLQKAPDSGADVVVFDLEDAVAPERKAEAREAVRAVLSDPAFDPDAEVCVRVNPVGTVADDDLAAVLDADPDAVMLPKVDGAREVETLVDLMGERADPRPVIALVESARGVLAADAVAATAGVTAVAFGAEDLAADVGAERTPGSEEVLFARQRVVTAAAAAGVDAVDTVYTDLADEAGLREATERGRQFGYGGKMAVHPAQVPVINAAFTPDEERVAWARRVLAAREEADAAGRGVFRVDDEMVDGPLVAQAERVRERARAAGTWTDAAGADSPVGDDGSGPGGE